MKIANIYQHRRLTQSLTDRDWCQYRFPRVPACYASSRRRRWSHREPALQRRYRWTAIEQPVCLFGQEHETTKDENYSEHPAQFHRHFVEKLAEAPSEAEGRVTWYSERFPNHSIFAHYSTINHCTLSRETIFIPVPPMRISWFTFQWALQWKTPVQHTPSTFNLFSPTAEDFSNFQERTTLILDSSNSLAKAIAHFLSFYQIRGKNCVFLKRFSPNK